ncbi:MAG: helix-turn-helix transcriptional regulator [Verrucomicrobia bacterium]|nr:helix-turn-helix transcriptional regulator [Verrucomicrobiota bacterium]
MDTDSFAPIFADAEDNDRYWEEMSILDFTESIAERLEVLGLSRTDLANKMGISPAFITKLMCGKNNFTIRTMVKVARALACELTVDLLPVESWPAASSLDHKTVFKLPVQPDLSPQDLLNQFTHALSGPIPGSAAPAQFDQRPENAEFAIAA